MFRGDIKASLRAQIQTENAKIQKQIQQLQEEIQLCKHQIQEIQQASQNKLVSMAKESKGLNNEAAKYSGPSIYEPNNADQALKILGKQSSLKQKTSELFHASLEQNKNNLVLVAALIQRIDEKSAQLSILEKSKKPSP